VAQPAQRILDAPQVVQLVINYCNHDILFGQHTSAFLNFRDVAPS
jgi:hypothetical protein